MNILCINTAFEQTYISLKNEEHIVTKTMNSSLKQSENVLVVIDDCLNNNNIELKDLNVISCVIGPGSFTGIRIGASLSKGFCMACPNIKKIEINSLDLIAYKFITTNNIKDDFYVVLNGLSGNIFACKYNNNGKQLIKPCLMFGDEISNLQGVVVGLKQENLDICNKFVEFDSKSLLNFTLNKMADNEYSNDFTPLYLRKSQAEAELDKKNENC